MNALKEQIGGNHYKKLTYQPVEFIEKLKLGFTQGCIIKYVSRYKDKNGAEDLQKVIHYAELAKELNITYNGFRNYITSLGRGTTNKFEITKYCDSNNIKNTYEHNIIEYAVYCKWDRLVEEASALLEEYLHVEINKLMS